MFTILRYKTLPSTQTKAKEFAKKGRHSLVIVAQTQTNAKGRFNREWVAKKGGLYFTLSLKETSPQSFHYLTFIAAIAVVNALKDMHVKAQIKWPNDLLLNDKKICGILTESILGKEHFILIGIGLNTNQRTFPDSISRIPTSVFLETGTKHDNKLLLHAILTHFTHLYKIYLQKNTEKIRILWKKHAHTLGRNISVQTLHGRIRGKAVDIDLQGRLVVRTTNGILKKIREGDVSY